MRTILTLALTFLACFAQAEKRHAGAHVHGLNHVQIVLDGTTLQVNYEFPIAQLQEHDEHKHDEHKHDEHTTNTSTTNTSTTNTSTTNTSTTNTRVTVATPT